MKPLARRVVASVVSAAMLAAQWPATAWAGAGAAAAPNPAATAEPNPAEAMKYMLSLGVYKDDADPLKTYFGSNEKLTPIGRIMYFSLKSRYNAAEEVEALKPVFDRLRKNGVYTPARQDGAARAMKVFETKFGELATAPAGSMEESFRVGGLREALMTGAAIADPPKGKAYSQREVADGYEFWDKEGLAFRMNKSTVTTYNRELQKTQRLMNLSRPPQVPAIPETGRYNYEMLQYSFFRLKNQEKEYIAATRVDRMIAMAELLGKQYSTDMWFNEKGLEEDLIEEAKNTTYDHRGRTYSVFEIVEEKFKQRDAYIEGAKSAVLRFETDMNRFKASNMITDSQVATMSLDEQNALRWLSLTVLEVQMFHVRNQRERVDPAAPDSQAIMKIIDESDMSQDQKTAYKEQGRRMKARLEELATILGKTRKALNDADYAGSLDSVQAALASSQKELGELSVDYSIYLEAPSSAFLAKSQATGSYSGLNPIKHLYNGFSSLARGIYKRMPWGDEYAENMKAIDGEPEDGVSRMVTARLWGASSWSQSGLVDFVAANVNDGSTDSAAFKTDTSAVGSYLQLDAGTAKRFVGVAIFSGREGSKASNSKWDVQCFDGAAPSTTVYRGIDLTANNGGWVEARWPIAEDGEHRYWRLSKTNPAEGGDGVYDVRFLEGTSMANAYADIAALIAVGRREDWVEARRRIIAMNPNATEYALSGALGGDPTKVSDALRISASLRANHERINAVTQTNKSLDAAANFVTWTVSIALLAPIARSTLNLFGKMSGVGINMINKGIKIGGFGGGVRRVVGRTMLIVGEIAKHSAARLESLEPDPGRVAALAGKNGAARYLVASGARALSVATRQTTFTAMSAGISSAFTVGTHAWDMAFDGHSTFSEDWDGVGRAAVEGFKGGAWWANESFHPALGYMGLPTTVFQGTKLAGVMEVIGTRGVLGSTRHGARVLRNGVSRNGLSLARGSAAVEVADAAASAAGRLRFLEKMAEARWYTGKPALAFGLSMADNVAKYALFSKVAGWVGETKSWGIETNIPILHAAFDNPEEDVERRIKRSKATGQAWFASNAWLMIPTYGAHGARDAGPYMMTKEGMKQYDKAGRTKEYANAYEGKILKLTPVKPPVAQRLFEARWFGKAPASEWIVTKQAKEAGQRKEIKRLAEEGGIVNPIELMGVRDIEAGRGTFRTLHVTEEVQKAAYEVAVEGLVAQAKTSLEALSAKKLGRTVKGWGEITPEIQIDIAKALYHAEVSLGRKLPPELSARVREVLKDHLLANLPIGEAGRVLRAAVVDLPIDSLKLDAAQREAIETILDWEVAAEKAGEIKAKQKSGIELTAREAETLALGEQSYLQLTHKLREAAEAKLKAGELTAKEGKALTALYDYIITGDKRFNSFNTADGVKARANVIFDALAIKFEKSSKMVDMVESYRKELGDWADSRKGQAANDNAAAEFKLTKLVARLERELKAKTEASPEMFGSSERAALENALKGVNNSAWVVRDAKGGAIPSWRAKQFVRLMQSFLGEGGLTRAVRLSTRELVEAVRAEHEGSAKLLSAVDGVEADVAAWVAAGESAKAGENPMSAMIEKLEARIKDAADLAPKESLALEELVEAISGQNREGLSTGILSSGRNGRDVELFVKAPTSLGKTLLAYEGLLPYLEAEAAASGRKVMFLTFNTKLQAQAEFDFLAYNKLGSTVKFETYEGLKTMIAEGKGKGRRVAEDYLMLQDEMDAAGQQPALTIGMVSGRVSRLNGQTTALNESNAGLAWSVNRLETNRIEAAEVQAQRVKSVADGISEVHVEPGRLGKIKTAANDVLEAIGQLKRAKGPIEAELAEKAVEKAQSALRELSGGSGMPEEAANAISGGLGRMKDALAERPSSNPVVRERLALEMEDAFLAQRRVMALTDTVEGLSRLPGEAGKARVALESKIENLQRDLALAEEAAGGAGPRKTRQELASRIETLQKSLGEAPPEARPGLETKLKNLRQNLSDVDAASASAGRRATLIREQIELATVEKAMIKRFDGVDASARLMAIDEQIAAIRSEQAPANRQTVNPKLERLVRESALLEAQGTPEAAARRAVVEARLTQLLKSMGAPDAAVLKAYRAEAGRAVRIENLIERTEGSIKAAKSRKEPTEALEARLTKLNAGREASRGELRKLETGLGAVKSTPKLDALVREAKTLEEGATPEQGMPPERRALHQEYRDLLERGNKLSERMGEADAGSRPGLESERATVRGRLRSIELELSAAPAKGDLGGALRRIDVLSSKVGRLERRIETVKAQGGRTGTLKSELKAARKEEAALRREARTEILERFDGTGAEIAEITRKGEAGWEVKVKRLLERRRALQEAYAGDESALYGAYRQMKESARPIGTDPHLTEKPYEITGGKGVEPGAAGIRVKFLIDRARLVEAKAKGGGAGPIQRGLEKAKAELEALSGAKESSEYMEVMNRMDRLETELRRTDSFYSADVHLKTINGASFIGFLPSLPKFLWQALTGTLPSQPTARMGLTRYHAAKMLKALANDPMLPAHQRDNLMWSYLGSLLFPKGMTGRGSSYVRSEIINMVQGFHDNPDNVRVDNTTGRFNVVHNGQWFESMDNASRRWWELEYGTDLTLPYTHNSMSTIKDVTTNKKAYFISLSGTAGNKFEAHLHLNKIPIVGEGSTMPKNVLLEIFSTEKQSLRRIAQSMETQKRVTADLVGLRETDVIPLEAKKGVEEYLAANGLKMSDSPVVKISQVPGEAAQAWLHSIRATQPNSGLTTVSVASTRAMKKVEAHLKSLGVKQNEIAKVFSDTEFLRQNVFKAKVLDQMNIDGLTTGKVKYLILVSPVAGRGLDLNFKGQRGSTAKDAFRGYTNHELFHHRAEKNSLIQELQVDGRIGGGRTLPGAPRKYTLLLDIESAGKEAVFRSMIEKDPFFVELRKDPAFQAYVRANGGIMDWHGSNNYLGRRAQDGTGEGQLLAQRADKAVRANLRRRNLEVEENLLRQSNVLTDAPTTAGKYPALERIR